MDVLLEVLRVFGVEQNLPFELLIADLLQGDWRSCDVLSQTLLRGLVKDANAVVDAWSKPAGCCSAMHPAWKWGFHRSMSPKVWWAFPHAGEKCSTRRFVVELLQDTVDQSGYFGEQDGPLTSSSVPSRRYLSITSSKYCPISPKGLFAIQAFAYSGAIHASSLSARS